MKNKKDEQNEKFQLRMEETMSVLYFVLCIQSLNYKIQNTKYNYGDDER